MRLRIFIMVLLSIINLILQSTVILHIPYITVYPNTMLVMVICYSVLRDDIEGSIFGFFNGLLFDIFFGRVIGFYALLGLIAGYLSAKPFREFNSNNYLTPGVIIFFMSIFYESLFYFFAFLFRGRTDFLNYFINIILPEAIFNVIIGIIVYIIVYLVNRRLEIHEKPKRKMFSSIGGQSGKI